MLGSSTERGLRVCGEVWRSGFVQKKTAKGALSFLWQFSGHDFLNNEIFWPRMFEYVWRKPELVLSLRGWSTEMGTDEHGREEHQHGDVLSPWWQTGHKHHKTKRSADQRCCFASQLDGLLKLARSYRLLADWTERARCGTTSRREEDHSPVGEGNGLIQTWGDFEGFHEVPATNDQRWGLCQTLWAVRAKPSKKYWDTWRKPKPNLQSESSVFEHVFF